MKDYLLDKMREHKKGLYLCELPTGNGKTFSSAWAMKEYADEISGKRKILYLTTLKKNIQEVEEELKKAYGSDELFNANVLRLKSNFDEVVEKICDVDVPEDMQTDAYLKLCKDVSLYHKAKEKNYNDKEYISELEERIKESDNQFRYEIKRHLKEHFHNKAQRKKAVKLDDNYRWIGILYPAVFTDEYKILLLSINKFMTKNTVIVDDSYEFLKSDLIDDAVIFIDEFDATKRTIQDDIIGKSVMMKTEYVQLFRQLYRNLNPNDFAIDIRRAMEQIQDDSKIITYDKLMERAREIAEQYHIRLSIKTKEDSMDYRRSFLFNDGSFHTVLKKGAKYIRTTLNEEENKLDIFFENKDNFYKNRNKAKDIVLYGLLREINGFLIQFRYFVYEWAKNYMNRINNRRTDNEDMMSFDNAVSTILKRLELTNIQKNILMGEMCKNTRNNRDVLLMDRSFYQMGMEYYELEDSDAHYDSTNLEYVKLYDTPEKIMLYLAKKAVVFGISATAEFNSVVGNYDLDYLEKRLKGQLHKTPEYLKKKTEINMSERWQSYYNGEINIHGEIIDSAVKGINAEEYCKTFMDAEFARYSANIITNSVEEEYKILRYCNVLKAMCKFNETDDIQSMLYLGMALAKRNNPAMDEDVLNKLFEYSQIYTGQKSGKLIFLRGDNFENDKEELLKNLGVGEKIFVMSSYQTIGAGQNLQYKAPEGKRFVYLGEKIEGDKRYLYKDFDSLYLADITYLTVNTYPDEKLSKNDLLHMLFQIEELYENGELNYDEKDQMLKLAFRSYSGSEQYTANKLFKRRSVILQASRMVLQAVGRMCRTFVKNPNIYIYIESELLDKISVGELKKRVLPPEMIKIISMRETLGKEYLPQENRILNIAEKISTQGYQYIRSLLSKDWKIESMIAWQRLRDLVLTYPTASGSDWENNEYINEYYITSGDKQDMYLYSQYSDFSDVVIDFGDDKLAFKNSKRAKIKGNSDEVAIFEMSERNSGLQEILRYPGMRDYFLEKGYATEFVQNEYLMSPVLFHNIYKGALGEEAGSYILKRELGIELEPITEPEYFEFFDYKLSEGVYVDFKNWKYTYVQDKDEIRKDIIRKLDAIGGKRVYIINIISDKNYISASSIDQRLVEIPMLINGDGTVCYECLHMIRKEDFEIC